MGVNYQALLNATIQIRMMPTMTLQKILRIGLRLLQKKAGYKDSEYLQLYHRVMIDDMSKLLSLYKAGYQYINKDIKKWLS